MENVGMHDQDSQDETRIFQPGVDVVEYLDKMRPRDGYEAAARTEYIEELVQKAVNGESDKSPVVAQASKAVRKAIREVHCARVLELAARKRLDAMAKKLHITVEETLGICTGTKTRVDIYSGTIRENQPEPRAINYLALAKLATDCSREQLDAMASGQLTSALAEGAGCDQGAKRFLRALAALLVEGGDGARRRVLDVCTNRDAAIAELESRPLMFLAETFLQEGAERHDSDD